MITLNFEENKKKRHPMIRMAPSLLEISQYDHRIFDWIAIITRDDPLLVGKTSPFVQVAAPLIADAEIRYQVTESHSALPADEQPQSL